MVDVFTWPAEWLRSTDIKFYARPNSLSSTQSATGTRSVYGPLVQVWMCEIASIPITDERSIRFMEAFLAKLGGIAGLIRIGHPARGLPYAVRQAAIAANGWNDGSNWVDGSQWFGGVLPATVSIVTAAPRGAMSLTLQGFPHSMSPALYAGDHIEIQPGGSPALFGHLYSVATDAASDGSGDLTVNLTIPLRAAVAAGDQVLLQAPKSTFRMIDNDQGIMQLSVPMIGQVGVKLMEVLP